MKKQITYLILCLFLLSTLVSAGALAKTTSTKASEGNGIVAVFNEVYDGSSMDVNTSASQNYQQIDFMYVAFVHVNYSGNSNNYDPQAPQGALNWENTPYKPGTYSGTGRQYEAAAYKNMYTLAHAVNPNMKFVVSLGWGYNFNDIPTIENNLTNFTNSLVTFIENQKAAGAPIDGFDIDYEQPSFSSTEKFKSVSTAIRTVLDAQGKKDGKHYYFTITPNNTAYLDGETLNSSTYDWINVQSYGYSGDARCPVTNFTVNLKVSPSKVLAGADTQNKANDYIQADNTYKSNNLAGVFGWLFGCIGNIWSPNYSSILTPMYQTTHSATHKSSK